MTTEAMSNRDYVEFESASLGALRSADNDSATEGELRAAGCVEHPQNPDETSDDLQQNDSAPHRGGDESSHRQTGSGSASSKLVDLALERYIVGITHDEVPYVLPKAGGHVAKMMRESRGGLKSELAREYRRREGAVAPSAALTDAINTLEGEASDTSPVDVHLRATQHEGVIYLDLADQANSVVRLDASGWEVITTGVPVRFRRTRLTKAFPLPQPGGDLDAMWQLLNITEEDRVLVIAFMIAALVLTDVPVPILALFAEQGSGKSCGMRMIVDLIDPSSVALRSTPRNQDDWIVAASGSRVVGLDNLSTVSAWFSDCLCRACTGDGTVKRALYTDDSLAVVTLQRVVIINGIEVGAMRGDLIERLLSVSMHRIDGPEKISERELNQHWNEIYPQVFGALLGLCVQVKAAMRSVRLETSPRMVDFATLLAALDQVLGTDGLSLYLSRANSLAQDSLSADPFLIRLRGAINPMFRGTSAELLEEVEKQLVDAGLPAPRGWPKNAMDVTGLLKRNAPALRSLGWTIENDEGKNKDSILRWTIMVPEDGTESAR